VIDNLKHGISITYFDITTHQPKIF